MDMGIEKQHLLQMRWKIIFQLLCYLSPVFSPLFLLVRHKCSSRVCSFIVTICIENKTGDEGARALANMLKHNHTITYLHLYRAFSFTVLFLLCSFSSYSSISSNYNCNVQGIR